MLSLIGAAGEGLSRHAGRNERAGERTAALPDMACKGLPRDCPQSQLRPGLNDRKPLIFLATPAGLEPATP
jgi:hypothetical protein